MNERNATMYRQGTLFRLAAVVLLTGLAACDQMPTSPTVPAGKLLLPTTEIVPAASVVGATDEVSSENASQDLATTAALPAAPASAAAVVISITETRATWVDVSGNETDFEVQHALKNADGTWNNWLTPGSVVARNGTGQTFQNLLAERTYRFRIRACNDQGCSAWTVSTESRPTPAAPVNVNARPRSDTRAQLTWESTSSGPSFQVQRALQNGDGTWNNWGVVIPTTPTGKEFLDSLLISGRTYQYRVRACFTACSAWSLSPLVPMPTFPAAPTNATATALSATQLRAKWTDKSLNETYFEVQYNLRNGDGTWNIWLPASQALSPANATQLDKTGVQPARIHAFRIRSCNVAGCSAWAVTLPVATPAS
jgi:hypothetical protein